MFSPNYKWLISHLKNKGFAGIVILALKVSSWPEYYRYARMTITTKQTRNFLVRKGLDKYYQCISRGNNRKYPQNYLIYNMVRKIKPKTVVEFGTGWSTVTIAAALNENFRLSPEEYGGVRPINHVIEAPDKWVDIVKKCLPGHLDEFCRFYLSTPKITVSNGELCSQYETLPDVSPDLIYVDGPGSSQIVGNINGLSMGRQVVADVKLYENKMSRECTVIIDSRLANLNWYLRNLVGYYRCTYVPLAEQAVLQKVEKLPPLRNNRNWLSALSSNRKFRRYLENEKNSTKIISLKGNYSLLP